MVYTSIFTTMSTLSPDPVIAYFEVGWYKEVSNEHENLSGLTIWFYKSISTELSTLYPNLVTAY